ncbi:MAG: glycyl-radical enzyme activating protein [Desulfobacterales bacterium]
MNTETRRPLIFNIHPFALDDGPGIRTTVFFKGCPLSCIWCHNPESMNPGPEIAFYTEQCIACGECEKVCPEQAIRLDAPQRILREKCTLCGLCARECPTAALKVMGIYYPQEELLKILLRDRIFYETSQGGVTFSGGEPTLHMEYLNRVMVALKKNEIGIAIETAGLFHFEMFEKKLLPYLDLIYFDLKLMDSGRHKQFTGRDNSRILQNFERLANLRGPQLIPRIPLVPEITATPENLTQCADFLTARGGLAVELLPYNPGGRAKRTALSQPIPAKMPRRMLDQQTEQRCRAYFSR